jgi:hypothetical protein
MKNKQYQHLYEVHPTPMFHYSAIGDVNVRFPTLSSCETIFKYQMSQNSKQKTPAKPIVKHQTRS